MTQGNDRDRSDDSAAKKAHGTHGKGGSQEERVDRDPILPDEAEGQERGSAAWGSAGSGGSVVDKRPPADERGA